MVGLTTRHSVLSLVALLGVAVGLWACLKPPPAPGTDGDADADGDAEGVEGDCTEVVYRDDLSAHPGCSTEGLEDDVAQIPGFSCAARPYVSPTEDTSKPVVILVHGNSDDPDVWEPSTDPTCDPPGADQGAPMLSDRLMDAGYRAYAVDMRSDLVCEVDQCDCSDYTICNPTRTMDHGWGVPLVMNLVEAVMGAYPDRQLVIIGHSFGATVARDALRRLFFQGVPVFQRIDHVLLLSGANHGVSSYCGYDCCGYCNTSRGRCACEMGFRDGYSPTCFSQALNGPDGAWEIPCADGQTAFGRSDACGGHVVPWTTIVMEDEADGSQRDLCSSEASAALVGAENLTIALESADISDYFYCTFLQHHFGSARSREALDLIMNVLAR
jgi:hypothetical protein